MNPGATMPRSSTAAPRRGTPWCVVTGQPQPGAPALHGPTLATAAAQGLTLAVYKGWAALRCW